MSLSLTDSSKLRIENGAIHYRLYRQDGSMERMTCCDTVSNRAYVGWIQSHDSYTGTGPTGRIANFIWRAKKFPRDLLSAIRRSYPKTLPTPLSKDTE